MASTSDIWSLLRTVFSKRAVCRMKFDLVNSRGIPIQRLADYILAWRRSITNTFNALVSLLTLVSGDN
jgi:hypothetical protein